MPATKQMSRAVGHAMPNLGVVQYRVFARDGLLAGVKRDVPR
jgi:hypothetical protein